MNMKRCECGCGTLIPERDRWRKRRRFVNGHAARINNGLRFEDAVEIVTPDGCWLWHAHRDRLGYGTLHDYSRPRGKSSDKAHRRFYRAFIGPIPEGFELDHLCGVRHCVNPLHLEAVTHVENVRRGRIPKLTLELARLIRQSDLSGAALAQQLGVSRTTIYDVRKGRIWREDENSAREVTASGRLTHRS